MSFAFVSFVIVLADSILPALYRRFSLLTDSISGWFSCLSFLFMEFGIVLIISYILEGLNSFMRSKLTLVYSILSLMESMEALAPKVLSI